VPATTVHAFRHRMCTAAAAAARCNDAVQNSSLRYVTTRTTSPTNPKLLGSVSTTDTRFCRYITHFSGSA
ncbi:unnamed protein product, partial [Ectocarpus sp. 12 AP-2014]